MTDRFKFSNFIPFEEPLLYDGILYHTVENFFQAMKTKEFSHRLDISKATPGQAKKFGRRLVLRKDWEDIKHSIMEFALRHKFARGTTAHETLMTAKPDELVEYNTHHDNYWGICLCATVNGGSGRYMCKPKYGQNHLGKALAKLRDDYNSGNVWAEGTE